MGFSDKVWNKLNIKGLATVGTWVSGNLDVNTDFSLLTAHWQDTTTPSNGLHVPHFHTLSFMLYVFLFYHSFSVLAPCSSEDYAMVLGLCPTTHLWRVHRGRVFSNCMLQSTNQFFLFPLLWTTQYTACRTTSSTYKYSTCTRTSCPAHIVLTTCPTCFQPIPYQPPSPIRCHRLL